MTLDANLRKGILWVAGAFIALGLLSSALTLEHFIDAAPAPMQKYMRISGYISAVLSLSGTLVTYILAAAFAWSMVILADLELSWEAAAYAGIWLVGLACAFQILGFALTNLYLFPLLEGLATTSREQYVAFVDRGIKDTTWHLWRERSNYGFLLMAPMAFGVGLAKSKEETAWGEVVVGMLGITVVLAVFTLVKAAIG